MGHPLHPLAGELARIAVADIGKQFTNAKDGLVNIKEVKNLAKEYLSHPKDVDWMDMTVLKWATAHIGEVNEAKTKGFIDKLHKEHKTHFDELSEQKRKMLREINKGLEKMEDLFEKAKDKEQYLDITKKARQNLNELEKQIQEWWKTW